MIKTIKQDILKTRCKLIAHQCNCKSDTAAGLARLIFEKWPESNVYKNDEERKLGQVYPTDTDDGKTILNIMGQTYPGKPKEYDSEDDREHAFADALSRINMRYMSNIAFPFGIGSGMAGGNWVHYLAMLEDFADLYRGDVFLYVLPEKKKKETNMSELKVYVDGSYTTKNPGIAGWGIITEHGTERGGSIPDCGHRQITGEMKAAMEAVLQAKRSGYSKVVIHYDYDGIEKWVTGEWRAKIEKAKLYTEWMKSKMKEIAIEFVHVSGSDNKADAVARKYTGAESAH